MGTGDRLSLPPLPTPPLSYREWLTGALQLIYAGQQALNARIEQLENTVMASGADLTAKLDLVEAAIAKEIQQLKDAMGNAATLAELQAAVNSSVTRLDKMASDLGGDDPAETPPTAR